MSVIRPFSAIRYNTKPNRDISCYLSPPYDVLNDDDRQELLARDPRNFVKIDLPHVPTQVRRTTPGLRSGLSDAAQLAGGRDHGQGSATRAVRLSPAVPEWRHSIHPQDVLRSAAAGAVREPAACSPTNGPLAGQKKTAWRSPRLPRPTSAQSLACTKMPPMRSAGGSKRPCRPSPLAQGTLDGVENLLWSLSEQGQIEPVAELMRPKPIYIADGHHRYGTALLYRDFLIEQHGELPGRSSG